LALYSNVQHKIVLIAVPRYLLSDNDGFEIRLEERTQTKAKKFSTTKEFSDFIGAIFPRGQSE
jgi:hypothetical protein